MSIANLNTNQDDIINSLGKSAKEASFILSQTSPEKINQILLELARSIEDNSTEILEKNKIDIEKAHQKNLSSAMIDRLTLSIDRLETIANSVREIAKLPCPVGEVLEEKKRPNGLTIKKTTVPIGVLGMIYESRPNVTVDAAALCLKSHNCVILRGGSESVETSRAFHHLIEEILEQNNLPKSCICMVPNQDRSLVSDMLSNSYIDVMIPRGGKGLTGRVMEEARMPVFAHLDGNCHIYVHKSVNSDIAEKVIINAKLRRTGICGAAESLLFDKDLEKTVQKEIIHSLLEKNCQIFGDQEIQKLDSRVSPATEQDWETEYLDHKISCKIVSDPEDAVSHINSYGSNHTDSILAEDKDAIEFFLNNVDSAIVMHNTSTQFADGGEFGMGAEIGIGTGKLHARGPVGIKQLVTFKYIVLSQGQIRP